jgi:hypothetical protein
MRLTDLTPEKEKVGCAMPQESLYDILGVAREATKEEINNAFRRQGVKWHPDRNSGMKQKAEEVFGQLAYAYKIVSDPKTRAAYDSNQDGAAQRSWQVSKEEAEKMLFQQFLNLAFTLIGRGLNEATVVKALTGLDCPVGVALAVTASAVKLAPQASAAGINGFPRANTAPIEETARAAPLPQAEAKSVIPKQFDIETATWAEAEPYYEAVIAGVNPTRTYSEQEKSEVSSKRIKLYIASGLVFLVLGFVAGFFGGRTKTNGGLGAFLGFVLGLILAGFFEGVCSKDIASYLRNKSTQYYLKDFENRHNKSSQLRFNVATFVLSLFWFSYRRMPFYAALWTGIYIVFISVMEFSGLGSQGAVNFVLWGVCVQSANIFYFKSSKSRIRKVMSYPAEQAVLLLRRNGGVNRWSWLIQLLFILIFSYALGTYQQRGAEQNGTQQSAASGSSAEQDDSQQQFDQAVREARLRYPELDPSSPRYIPDIEQAVGQKMQGYMLQGRTRVAALNRAMEDQELAPKAKQ